MLFIIIHVKYKKKSKIALNFENFLYFNAEEIKVV